MKKRTRSILDELRNIVPLHSATAIMNVKKNAFYDKKTKQCKMPSSIPGKEPTVAHGILEGEVTCVVPAVA